MDCPNNIKKIREERGMTAYRLAKEMEVHKTVVSNWERGLNYPNIPRLKKLKQILNCSIDELVGD